MAKKSSAGNVPPINCAHDKLVSTGKLKPNPKNPNQHPKEQLALYAKILRKQGWRKPIIVSNQTGLIVTGHGAWLTAKAEGWADVPVDFQDFKSTAEEQAHLLADNRLPQLAEFDDEALARIIEELQGEIDLDLTAFDVGALNGDASLPASLDLPEPPASVKENLDHLREIKEQRKKGNAGIISKTDTEFYLVLAFPNRAAKEQLLKRLGLPEDERYLDPASVLILPGSGTKRGKLTEDRRPKRPKSSPANKSGACG